MKVFLVAFLFCGAVFAAKGYQVTGTVLEVKSDTIVVDKKGEKFEIAWPAGTKVTGGTPKKGDKVTVYYTMSATEAEVKADKKKK